MRCLGLRLTALIPIALHLAAANAQQPGTHPSSQDEIALQEVVVTAERQPEKLLDVPETVSVVTSNELRRLGATSLADIAEIVPGLDLSDSSPGQSRVTLRGIYAAAGDPTVSTYIDDVPLPQFPNDATFIGLADPQFFDLDRIEVLQGPQGTLFGADSEGGAIRYILNAPRLNQWATDANLQLSGTQGGGPNYLAGGMVNDPLVPDHVAVRLATQFSYDDGYIDRVQSGLPFSGNTTQSNVNTLDRIGVRLSSLIHINENLDITPTVYYQKAHAGAWNVFNNLLPEFETDFRGTGEPQNDAFTLAWVTVRYHLQDATLTSVSSYYKRTFTQVRDYSQYVLGLLGGPQSPVAQPFANDTFTNWVDEPTTHYEQELRLQSDSSTAHRLPWILGLYYAYTNIDSTQDVYDPEFVQTELGALGATPYSTSDVLFLSNTQLKTTEVAAFANASYHFTNELSLSAGARYFWNRRLTSSFANGFFNGGLTSQPALSTKDDGIDPRVSLNLKPNTDNLLYVSAAKGYRIGGPNQPIPLARCQADLNALGLTEPPSAYRPDYVWSYELGSKNELLNHRLAINSALFYIPWDNVQQEVPLLSCGFSFVGNAGKALSEGGQTEVQVTPARGLILSGSFSYTDATLQAAAPELDAQKGDPIEWVPKYTYSLGIQYQRSMLGNLAGYALADYRWRSAAFRNYLATSPDYEERPYGVAFLRIGVIKNSWDVSLFVSNLLNVHPILDMTFPSTNPVVYNDTTLQPRTIGVNVNTTF